MESVSYALIAVIIAVAIFDFTNGFRIVLLSNLVTMEMCSSAFWTGRNMAWFVKM